MPPGSALQMFSAHPLHSGHGVALKAPDTAQPSFRRPQSQAAAVGEVLRQEHRSLRTPLNGSSFSLGLSRGPSRGGT